MIVSGMAIAPTLIASVAVTQSSVDQTRLTEALAWISTGMAAGVAVGAAAVGHVIDSSGQLRDSLPSLSLGCFSPSACSSFVARPAGPSGIPNMDVPAEELTQCAGTPPAESSHRQVGTPSR